MSRCATGVAAAAWLSLGALVGPTGLAAQGATEASDALLKADCRLAAQTLATGRPAPHWDWAIGAISRCDESAGPGLAKAWSIATVDSATLSEMVRTSRDVQDGRLFEALVAVASDPAAGWWRRASALRVLAAYVAPQLMFTPDHLRPSPTAPGSVRILGHVTLFQGTTPMPADSKARTRALFLRLVESDPDSGIRSAASFLEKELSVDW